MLNIWGKLKNVLDHIGEVLGVILSIIVIVVVVMAIFFLKTPLLEYLADPTASGALLTFITYVLNIVICVELFKVLCSPETETVLDIMMFVIVRHMIVNDTTAIENFLTILGVVVIIMVKKYVLQNQWCSGKKIRKIKPEKMNPGHRILKVYPEPLVGRLKQWMKTQYRCCLQQRNGVLFW